MRFNFLRKLFQNEKVNKRHEIYTEIYGYDFDGVISIGVNPRSECDVIITGRCIDEAEYVLDILKKRGIKNTVYFNQMTLAERGNHTLKARRYSGEHKAKTITYLKSKGVNIVRFFEDDTVQMNCIAKKHEVLDIVHIKSNLVEK
jgi:hypothetical protein